MPTYQYRCTECGNELEAVQKFSDPSLTDCPDCTGQLRKVFNAVGVVFKGSGFYRTDSRADAKKSGGSDSAAAAKSDSSSGTSTEKATSPAGSSADKPARKSESKQPVTAGASSSGSGSNSGSSTAA